MSHTQGETQTQAITSVTQIPGIRSAHVTNSDAGTGVTVIICEQGCTGAVDVRGGAPATHETDLLRAEETVDVVHAVVLSGGSSFGLAASSGVADELERRGYGLDVFYTRVPIVVGASLFDLGCGAADVRPTHADGIAVVEAAFANNGKPLAQGNVGAGTGCTVGKLDPTRAMKSGFGEAVEQVGELICGAVSAVNAVGDVIDPQTGKAVAGLLSEDRTQVIDSVQYLIESNPAMPLERTNTTISCVITNARLTKAQATKVAQMSADAYAHAIRPTHTTNDGDTIFVLATGEVEASVDVVGVLATRVLECAIVNGARSSESAYGFISAHELEGHTA
ncbi:MAG: P1 family peptidase [Atopobiaceae bacterium]|nr:P1 family peptidase [Atopobiaceae bacterium]